MVTRGQLSRQTGCHIETIRYYEKIGLLEMPARNPKGYRIYDSRHITALRFIQRAKTLGFSNDRIQDFLRFSGSRSQHTRSEVKALTETHLREITGKIEDLEKLRRYLKRIAESCDGSEESAEDCPILLSLFVD
ncbi:MAG: MerR family transcriptional regulator [Gammaproteobacteria bacterium]|nr:MerR family transcriptional regulator [Gammaproteobacteria bacterium]